MRKIRKPMLIAAAAVLGRSPQLRRPRRRRIFRAGRSTSWSRFPPGGPTDFVGRLVAEKMKDALGQTRHHRQQARRQRHARRRIRRQVRPRRLHAVPHHGGRGDGVAAYHGRISITIRCAISRRSRWSPRSPRCWSSRRSSASRRVKELVALAKAQARRHSLRLDRHRLAAASGAGTARRVGRREIPARALSRRGAGA